MFMRLLFCGQQKQKIGKYSQHNFFFFSQPNLNQFSSEILFWQNLEIIRNNLKQ